MKSVSFFWVYDYVQLRYSSSLFSHDGHGRLDIA